MAVDKLAIDDSRVEHHNADIKGKNYHYLLGKPSGTPVGTVLLVHGFPDLAFGWRYQVPFLLSLNYQVIVPDMLGYGQTSCPEDLNQWGMKSMSDDIAALVAKIVGPEGQIILGGHDWGGAFVWRFALWYPQVLKGVFAVCTPYAPPSKQFYDLADIIATGRLKNFTYQLHLRGPEVEAHINSDERIRQFLNGMFAGKGPNSEFIFNTEKGIIFEYLPIVGQSPFLSKEEVDYYVKEYTRNGMRGPLNWYRSRKISFDEELPLAEKGQVIIKTPTLFIAAKQDKTLLPSMSDGMEKLFGPSYKRVIVDASHWALWQAAQDVNKAIGEWLETLGTEGSSKASL